MNATSIDIPREKLTKLGVENALGRLTDGFLLKESILPKMDISDRNHLTASRTFEDSGSWPKQEAYHSPGVWFDLRICELSDTGKVYVTTHPPLFI